jgi:hypothetical protein
MALVECGPKLFLCSRNAWGAVVAVIGLLTLGRFTTYPEKQLSYFEHINPLAQILPILVRRVLTQRPLTKGST